MRSPLEMTPGATVVWQFLTGCMLIGQCVLMNAATGRQQWSFCPFSGGFDFRTYASEASNKLDVRSRNFRVSSQLYAKLTARPLSVCEVGTEKRQSQ